MYKNLSGNCKYLQRSVEVDSNNIKFYGNFKLRLPIQLIKQDMSF